MWRVIFIALTMITSTPLVAAAYTVEEAEQCLQVRFDQLSRGGVTVNEIFDLSYITGAAIGPTYRGLDRDSRQRAMTTAATVIRDGVQNNQNLIGGLTVEVRTIQPVRGAYQVTGRLGRHGASALITENCHVRNIEVGSTSIRSWLREAEEMQQFQQ